MFSMYQVIKNCITDSIDVLHYSNYSKPTAAAQIFGINIKTVQ